MLVKLIIASLLTGIISGLFITFYELVITFFTYFFFMGDPSIWYLYLLPTVAIFLVNYMVSRDKNIREYGVDEIA